MKVERLTKRDIVVKFSRKHLVELASAVSLLDLMLSMEPNKVFELPEAAHDFIKFVNDNLRDE